MPPRAICPNARTRALTRAHPTPPTLVRSVRLHLATSQIVAPGDMLTVPGEGLVGGDLVIYFEIQFPKTLTPAQKKTIKGVGM